MLEAFNRIAAANPEARLIVAGDGPVTTEVEESVNRSMFRDRIDLVGKVGREEMPGLIRTATIVCAPSFGEPFGMIVLEAMATGKPVAATRAGGIPYLLERSGGLLVEPGDASGLAEVLDRLLRDPALAASTGNSNREIAVSQYAWDRVAQGVERAYAVASSNA